MILRNSFQLSAFSPPRRISLPCGCWFSMRSLVRLPTKGWQARTDKMFRVRCSPLPSCLAFVSSTRVVTRTDRSLSHRVSSFLSQFVRIEMCYVLVLSMHFWSRYARKLATRPDGKSSHRACLRWEMSVFCESRCVELFVLDTSPTL